MFKFFGRIKPPESGHLEERENNLQSLYSALVAWSELREESQGNPDPASSLDALGNDIDFYLENKFTSAEINSIAGLPELLKEYLEYKESQNE